MWRPGETLRAAGPLLLLLLLLALGWGRAWRFLRTLALAERLPGPRAWPLVGNVFDFGFNTTDIVKNGIAMGLRFAPTCRAWVGPLLNVWVVDPEDLEKLMSSYSFLEKGPMYRFLHPWLGTGLLTSTGDKWRKHRKILTPAFHFKILDQFLPVFGANSDIFIGKLGALAGGPGFDLFPLVQLLTMDVICETAMGVKVNAQTDSTSPYVRAQNEMNCGVVQRMFRPWLHADWLFALSGLGRQQAANLRLLHRTSEEVIVTRRRELLREIEAHGVESVGSRRRLAFLDVLLLSEREGAGLSDRDIREEVDTFMFEGQDTTATGLAMTLWLLAKHPDVQEKVVSELRGTGLGAGALPKMRYVEAVLKEGLRLYPPVISYSRKAPQDIALSSGHVIPAGADVHISPAVLHRRPELYPEPERFLPERWLEGEGEGEGAPSRHPFAYLTFSAGPRNCIGQKFAMLEMKTVVAKTLWNFKLATPDHFEPKLSVEVVLKPANGLLVTVEKRDHAP